MLFLVRHFDKTFLDYFGDIQHYVSFSYTYTLYDICVNVVQKSRIELPRSCVWPQDGRISHNGTKVRPVVR